MLLTYCFVLLAALIAGFLGPLVGGGGLLTLPVLIIAGLSPEVAIASTRLAAIGMWLTAIHSFHKRNVIDWQMSLKLSGLGVLGGCIGSSLLVYASKWDLTPAVAVIMLLMLPVLYFKDKFLSAKRVVSKKRQFLSYFAFLITMIFAAFFTGGDGTLAIIVLHLFFGMSLLEANAQRALPWLCMTSIATAQYAASGLILYDYAFVLLIGLSIGAKLGVNTGFNKGEEWVRKLFFTIVLFIALYLLTSS